MNTRDRQPRRLLGEERYRDHGTSTVPNPRENLSPARGLNLARHPAG